MAMGQVSNIDHLRVCSKCLSLSLCHLRKMMTMMVLVVSVAMGQVSSIDGEECQTRTTNDVPNVPVNLALSSN